jgi:hypothetical protein
MVARKIGTKKVKKKSSKRDRQEKSKGSRKITTTVRKLLKNRRKLSKNLLFQLRLK